MNEKEKGNQRPSTYKMKNIILVLHGNADSCTHGNVDPCTFKCARQFNEEQKKFAQRLKHVHCAHAQ